MHGKKKNGAAFDAQLGQVGERLVRRMSRRSLVRNAIVGGATGMAAIMVGETPALADACTSNCGPTKRCGGCPAAGCPSGYKLCYGSRTSSCFNTQGYRCEWPSGTWIACTGLGRFGNGIEVCYDCKPSSGCAHWCTCLSQCICCNCTTAAEVRAAQLDLQQRHMTAPVSA